MQEVRLTDSDRTIFAICPVCNRSGLGIKAPKYFSMAYAKRQWEKNPVCDNCKTQMEKKYEIEVERHD